jgi:thiamine kinase-like enzyme
MMLADGRIKLLDFAFSSFNHPAFDLATLFAETVMEHGQLDPPYFSIAEPSYTRGSIALLIGHYLDCGRLEGDAFSADLGCLTQETVELIMSSEYMYAMAAIPLAVKSVQKIRFTPYAHARWNRFLAAYGDQYGYK